VFRTGTTVTHTATEVAPTVERFCTEVERRTGLRLSSTPGNPASGESSVRIELATGNELGVFTRVNAAPVARPDRAALAASMRRAHRTCRCGDVPDGSASRPRPHDARCGQVPGEAGTVGAGALHSDPLHRAEGTEPARPSCATGFKGWHARPGKEIVTSTLLAQPARSPSRTRRASLEPATIVTPTSSPVDPRPAGPRQSHWAVCAGERQH
jgi:hypothetical protein